MFTGIIEGRGVIRSLPASGGNGRIAVETEFDIGDSREGDSIAVNGACLTLVTIENRGFEADVAPETLTKTTLGSLRSGETVNLERALRLSDRLGGHLVTGHIDGTGIIRDRRRADNAVIVSFAVDPVLSAYMVSKGSVAIDGISLTVNNCGQDYLEVSVIPHTAEMTTIGRKRRGESVNVETDIIAKYVKHFLTAASTGEEKINTTNQIDKDFLAKAGFL